MKGLSPGDFCDNDTAAAAKSLSRVQLCAAPWSAAHQAPPSMGFSRQEYWSGSPVPSPERRYANGQNADINIY